MQRILAATDLSQRGEHAVARGAELAGRFGAELVLLHAVDDELPEATLLPQLAQSTELLDASASRLGVKARVRVERGLDFQVIAKVAAAEAADLVVVGPHRRSLLRDLFIGTTVERLLRVASLPVLVARDADARPYAKVLAAVDLIEEAVEVIALAARLAAAGPVHLVHVRIDPVDVQLAAFGTSAEASADHRKAQELRVHELLARLARQAGVDAVIPKVLHGGPVATSLATLARDLAADLVVMGTTTQSRGALERWLLASQAEQALIEAEIDVLCLPLGGTTRLADAPSTP